MEVREHRARAPSMWNARQRVLLLLLLLRGYNAETIMSGNLRSIPSSTNQKAANAIHHWGSDSLQVENYLALIGSEAESVAVYIVGL